MSEARDHRRKDRAKYVPTIMSSYMLMAKRLRGRGVVELGSGHIEGLPKGSGVPA